MFFRLSRLILCVALICWAVALPADEPPIDPARLTPTVRLIERCLPAVVAMRVFSPTDKPEETRVNLGSGSIVHPAGYILTNQHVVHGAQRGEVVLAGGEVFAYRQIAAFAHEDLALIKVNADHPLPTLALGRSHDLLLGEPVLAIGSPVGLVSSVSEGIVSGLKRSTSTEHAFLPTMIQTSAAISGGSSGGPLINALGEQVGLITSRKADAENIGFAIAIDRVREMLPAMLAPEQRYGFLLGLEVDMLAAAAKVTRVAPESPAAVAGIQPGDVLTRFDALELHNGLDFQLGLIDRKPGQQLMVALARGPEMLNLSLTLAELPLAKPASESALEPGVRFAAYHGEWLQLPDFASLAPVEQGHAEKPSLAVSKSRPDHFGLEFTGFIKLPSDGLYTFALRSDDGSRLYLGDRLLVDNDGAHPPREAAGLVRLAAGLYPIKLQYFEVSGDELLTFSYEGPGIARQEVPAAAFFRRAEK